MRAADEPPWSLEELDALVPSRLTELVEQREKEQA
jgi:hypothetical protein